MRSSMNTSRVEEQVDRFAEGKAPIRYSSSQLITHWVSLDTDHRSPFHERAHSRSLFLKHVSSADLLTRSGFFSLLVFRGTTFGARFVSEAGMADDRFLFRDLDHWLQTVQIYRDIHHKDDKYFCVKNSYSTTSCNQRLISNPQN